MVRSPRLRLGAALFAMLAVAACGGSGTPAPPNGGGGASPGASAPAASAQASGPAASAPASAGSGASGYEGTITTSGLYAATWSAGPGVDVNPFNASEPLTVASDKGTYGNVGVKPDGSISFGSAAPEFVNDLSFAGTGAKVTLDSSGQFVCAFTVDADLKGTRDGAILHLSGSMTVHWNLVGGEGTTCP